jgi:hypothetical protein
MRFVALTPGRGRIGFGAVGLAFALLASASPARGEFITARFNSAEPDLALHVVLRDPDNGGPLRGFNGTAAVGQYNWQRTGGDYAGIADSFSTFCIELTENISLGNTYRYDVVGIEAAPLPGNNTDPIGSGVSGPMGAVKAERLRKFWGSYHDLILSASTTAQARERAAAFQLGIWEIVFDHQANVADYNVADGRFYATQNTASRTLANTWLRGLDGQTGYESRLVALSNIGAQDQITLSAVPAPPTVVLAGVGAVCALGFRRWRRPATA